MKIVAGVFAYSLVHSHRKVASGRSKRNQQTSCHFASSNDCVVCRICVALNVRKPLEAHAHLHVIEQHQIAIGTLSLLSIFVHDYADYWLGAVNRRFHLRTQTHGANAERTDEASAHSSSPKYHSKLVQLRHLFRMMRCTLEFHLSRQLGNIVHFCANSSIINQMTFICNRRAFDRDVG